MNTFLFILFLLLPRAYAGVDVRQLADEIRRRTCESALVGGGSGAAAAAQELLFVVGLGNHGYTGTRHNLGVDLVTHLEQTVPSERREAPEHWLEFDAATEAEAEEYVHFSGASSPWRNGLKVHYRVGGEVGLPNLKSQFKNIVFVYPHYDINESGHFVAALVQELHLKLNQVVVVADDISLPRNQVALSSGRVDGSGDGHNGLKSLNAELGSGGYMRLRIGVSTPKAEKQDISLYNWVLGPVQPEDQQIVLSQQRLRGIGAALTKLQQRLMPGARSDQLLGEANREIKRLNPL